MRDMKSKRGVSAVAMAMVLVAVFVLLSVSVVYYAIRTGKPAAERSVVDDYGRTVTFSSDIQKIITFGPSATEVACSIGLGNRIVAVDDYSDFPPGIEKKEKIGSFNLDYEKIAVLKPDLIIAADILSKQNLAKLETAGYPVIMLSPKTIFGVLQDIRIVGLATGMEKTAANVSAALQKRVDAVSSKIVTASNFPRVYLEYYPLFTYGPNSIGNELVLAAGGINIAANTTSPYPMISNEFVIVSDPQVIVYTVGPYTNSTAGSIKSRPGWDDISAVKNDNIQSIDDNIVVRPGPRVVDALEQMAAIIHPELFS